METASAVVGPDEVARKGASRSITLVRDERYRRRVAMTADCGFEFLLDLAEATYLADGSGLQLEGGEIVQVIAAAEPLIEIRAETPEQLMKIAWHIGNRHTPAEIAGEALYIQPDHVLAEMVRGLGGNVHEVTRPFEPEGGAYGHHGSLHQSHHHGAPHDHAHGHGHTHEPGHSHHHHD